MAKNAQSVANLQKSNTPHAAFGAPFSARVFYCPACDVPVVTPTSQVDEVTGKSLCPLCGGATRYLATDLRPVFPEERLLLELLLGAEPLSLAEKSVWAQDSRYYIGGKARSVSAKVFSGAAVLVLLKRIFCLDGITCAKYFVQKSDRDVIFCNLCYNITK